ncbi:MFS transporter [Hydrogenophaga sp. OTU3427]|uniref:MFS transporter n=1 Tax=Hydrogenophaga sp. OTU3427 TaxID=3043856 RepID=UPI00313BB77E
MSAPSAPSPRLPGLLYLFALCNLVLGSGAFGLGGILEQVAIDLKQPVQAVGQNMTAYAFATALLAPLLLVLAGRWRRRTAVLATLAMFALGVLVSVLATDLRTLLLGRVLMGAGASFTPLAAGIAVALVPPAQRGKALSTTFLGMSMSYVVGVPLGAWIGLAHGWRWPQIAVLVLLLLMMLLVWRLMPADVNAPGSSFKGLGSLLRRGDVLRTLTVTLLYFTAIFSVFSYIGPVLLSLVPLSPGALSGTLVIFGLAGVAGTLSGGWANDRFGALPSLRVQLSGLLLMMLLVPLTKGLYLPLLLVMVTWGICGFGMMAPQQSRLASVSPPQAPLLLSLNTSMLYFGTALGAAAGGMGSPLLGFDHLPWLGAVFAGLGLVVLLTTPSTQAPAPVRAING